MLSSPSASPTNGFQHAYALHLNRCHPACPELSRRERSEGSAFTRSASPSFAFLLFDASTFRLIFARPLFSYSYALFCHSENDKLFVFRRFHTLCPKHPGWGYPLPSKFLSFRNPTTHHSLLVYPNASRRATIPFRIRTSAKRARNSRRIRTSKTQHLKPFGMNTYRKTGEGGTGCNASADQNLSSRAHRGICFFTVRPAPHYSLPTTSLPTTHFDFTSQSCSGKDSGWRRP